MKLYRWFEGRLTGKRNKSKLKNKKLANLNEETYLLDHNLAFTSIESHLGSKQEIFRNENQVFLSRKSAFDKNIITNPLDNDHIHSSTSSTSPISSATSMARTSASSTSSTASSLSMSGLPETPLLGKQRSRIKTNPWLRSPWLSRTSYRSTSTDSGCILLNPSNNNNSENTTGNDNDNTRNNNNNNNSNNNILNKTSGNNENGKSNENNNEVSKYSSCLRKKLDALDYACFENKKKERYTYQNSMIPCSSSDEFVSSASSSSVFSSRSSSLSSNSELNSSEANWSMLSQQNLDGISTLSSDALAAIDSWSLTQIANFTKESNQILRLNSFIGSFYNEKSRNSHNDKRTAAETKTNQNDNDDDIRNNNNTINDADNGNVSNTNCSTSKQIISENKHFMKNVDSQRLTRKIKNKRKLFPIYSKYSRAGKNEEWVPTATDLICLSSSTSSSSSSSASEDEIDDSQKTQKGKASTENSNERYVPSPAPPEPKQSHNEKKSLFKNHLHDHHYFCYNYQKISDQKEQHQQQQMQFSTYCGLRKQKKQKSIIDHPKEKLREYLEKMPKNSLDQQINELISPIKADSGIGLSESSISTTPSGEECNQAHCKQILATTLKENNTEQTICEKTIKSAICSNDTKRASLTEKDIIKLSDKVRKLRTELKNIVDVTIKEAREEEMRIREERLIYLREMIEYKRFLLTQCISELKYRIDDEDRY